MSPPRDPTLRPRLLGLPVDDLRTFLAAIAEEPTRPGEDALRLQLADWIDEQGVPEWAGFVRAATLLGSDPYGDEIDGVERQQLIDDLNSGEPRQFATGLRPAVAPGRSLKAGHLWFDRGLPTGVQRIVSDGDGYRDDELPADIERFAEALPRLPWMTGLSLAGATSRRVTEAVYDLPEIDYPPRLRRLALPADITRRPPDLRVFGDLQALYMQGWPESLDSEWYPPKLPRLRRLGLDVVSRQDTFSFGRRGFPADGLMAIGSAGASLSVGLRGGPWQTSATACLKALGGRLRTIDAGIWAPAWPDRSQASAVETRVRRIIDRQPPTASRALDGGMRHPELTSLHAVPADAGYIDAEPLADLFADRIAGLIDNAEDGLRELAVRTNSLARCRPAAVVRVLRNSPSAATLERLALVGSRLDRETAETLADDIIFPQLMSIRLVQRSAKSFADLADQFHGTGLSDRLGDHLQAGPMRDPLGAGA